MRGTNVQKVTPVKNQYTAVYDSAPASKEKKMIEALFKAFDTNNDGFISSAEIDAVDANDGKSLESSNIYTLSAFDIQKAIGKKPIKPEAYGQVMSAGQFVKLLGGKHTMLGIQITKSDAMYTLATNEDAKNKLAKIMGLTGTEKRQGAKNTGTEAKLILPDADPASNKPNAGISLKEALEEAMRERIERQNSSR